MKIKLVKWITLLITAGLAAGFVIYSSNLKAPKQENQIRVTTDAKLKQMIGQMLIVGFRGTEIDGNSKITKTIKGLNLGGVVLTDYDIPSKTFPRNIVSPDQTKQLVSSLKTISPLLFIAVDLEGGQINRLKPEYGFINIISAQEIGKDKTLKTTKREAEKIAKELKNLGFNMDFAPVVDLNINPKNPIIGKLERSFSNDPKTVIDNASIFIEALDSQNIITVAKHFPGHGSSLSDSHLGITDITKTFQEKELLPYYELEKQGLLKVVMVGHLFNSKVDEDLPASLSSKFIQGILRQQIGFQGVVISDDIQMGAITKNYGFEESLIKAINAGNNILILANNSAWVAYDDKLAEKAVNIIFEAVKQNKIPQEKIRESSERIYKLKLKYNLF